MDIVVRGKNVEVSPRLRKLAREKIDSPESLDSNALRVQPRVTHELSRFLLDNLQDRVDFLTWPFEILR